jgi:hypothetical protein
MTVQGSWFGALVVVLTLAAPLTTVAIAYRGRSALSHRDQRPDCPFGFSRGEMAGWFGRDWRERASVHGDISDVTDSAHTGLGPGPVVAGCSTLMGRAWQF